MVPVSPFLTENTHILHTFSMGQILHTLFLRDKYYILFFYRTDTTYSFLYKEYIVWGMYNKLITFENGVCITKSSLSRMEYEGH